MTRRAHRPVGNGTAAVPRRRVWHHVVFACSCFELLGRQASLTCAWLTSSAARAPARQSPTQTTRSAGSLPFTIDKSVAAPARHKGTFWVARRNKFVCGLTPLASTASEANADAQTDAASLVPDARFVTKVCIMALLPYFLRCGFDFARGFRPDRPCGWQVGFAVMWALNTLAIAIPGRFDGRSAGNINDEGQTVTRYITPAGWAFAIWGPIFLGEYLAMVYLTAFAAPQSSLVPISLLATTRVGSAVAPGWCAAIAAQIGWCATFRPQLGKAGLWISTVCLGLTAILLGGVHRKMCALASEGALSIVSNLLVRFPITLHFGWISCATLVNFNNWMANNGSTLKVRLAAAFATILVAVAAAVFVSATTHDPIFAFVVTWSLYAVYKFSERDGSPRQLRAVTLCGAAASFALMLLCIGT